MQHLFKTSNGDLRVGWKAALLIVGALLFGILLTGIVMAVLTGSYVSQGLAQEQAMEQATLASGEFVVQVILSVLQLGFLFWIVRWLVVKLEKQPFDFSKLGLVSADRSKHILLGIALAVILSLLTIGIGVLTGSLKYLGNGLALFGAVQVVSTLLLTVLLAVASGVGEELAFRGYLQTRFAQRYNPATAVVIVAVLFAFSHPPAGENYLLYLVSAISVGILFGAIFLRTGSLWMGIALHTIWNYLQIAVLAVRNTADERFFGSPLFVFATLQATQQMLIELGIIVLGFIFILWVTKSNRKTITAIWQEN